MYTSVLGMEGILQLTRQKNICRCELEFKIPSSKEYLTAAITNKFLFQYTQRLKSLSRKHKLQMQVYYLISVLLFLHLDKVCVLENESGGMMGALCRRKRI